MEIDLSPLTAFLETAGHDGYFIDDDASDSDQRYVSQFSAPDAYQTLVTPDGSVHLLVSGLEYGRAVKEAGADTVTKTADYDSQELVAEHGRFEGGIRLRAAFLSDHGVESLAVPKNFPTGVADGLREQGLEVTVEREGIVGDIRAVKHDEEIEHLAATQAANQEAMAVAESLIAAADIANDGTLEYDGQPLTSERVTQAIEVTLLRAGCSLDETIVACGEHGADPHDRGSGPLEANELIVIDIFPRDKETKYFGDMTRTFCRGEPTAEMVRRYEVTEEAFEAALEATVAGATGKAVHDAACDVIEDAGYATLRSDPTTDTGFIHSTGHGVGLDIHEGPSLSPVGGDLEPGHVVTVEPGIYDPAVGGVRIEDMVVVTEDGYENLTDYPISLEPQVRTSLEGI